MPANGSRQGLSRGVTQTIRRRTVGQSSRLGPGGPHCLTLKLTGVHHQRNPGTGMKMATSTHQGAIPPSVHARFYQVRRPQPSGDRWAAPGAGEDGAMVRDTGFQPVPTRFTCTPLSPNFPLIQVVHFHPGVCSGILHPPPGRVKQQSDYRIQRRINVPKPGQPRTPLKPHHSRHFNQRPKPQVWQGLARAGPLSQTRGIGWHQTWKS